MNQKYTYKDAMTRCHMTAEEIRMAKILGMSPQTLINNIPSKAESRWKDPVALWVIRSFEKKILKIEKYKMPKKLLDKTEPPTQEELAEEFKKPVLMRNMLKRQIWWNFLNTDLPDSAFENYLEEELKRLFAS